MAVKKKTMKKKEATPAKPAAKEGATKTPKKKAAPAAASAALAPAPAAEPASKPAAKKAAPKKAAPKKAAAPATAPAAPAAKAKPKATAAAIKLSDSQTEILSKVLAAGEAGYRLDKKSEQKSLESLQNKKLIKTGKKDKDGSVPYLLTAAGKKHGASTKA